MILNVGVKFDEVREKETRCATSAGAGMTKIRRNQSMVEGIAVDQCVSLTYMRTAKRDS